MALVDKTRPTHAGGMRDLVGISVGVRQGEPFEAMRLDFEMNCGTSFIRVNGADFVVALRTCFVALELDDCEVQTHSRYEHSLTPGSVESASTETLAREDRRELGADLEASATASSAGKPGLLAKIAGKAGRSRRSGATSQETLKRQSRIDLVMTAGQDRWQVGDPRLGDGRRSDGRLLGTYFGEGLDSDGEPKPMCVIVGGVSGTSTVTVSAVVRFGQILVGLGAEEASPIEREDLDLEINSQTKQVRSTHRRRATELRARMAGLVLAKALHRSRNDPERPREGEVLIARQSIALASRRALKGPPGAG